MEIKDKTPETHAPNVPNVQLNIKFDVYEGKGRNFTGSTKKVYELFLAGGRYSVVEITKILNIPDPRSSIRDIRNTGINISDTWIKSVNSRYKVYFLK